MKRILLSLFLLVNLVANAQQIVIRSIKNENVDLSEFNTYFWAGQADNQLDDEYYFVNDLVLKADIRAAVREEMEGRGYAFSERNPDLLVNFRVFDKKAEVKGTSGAGRNYWSEREFAQDDSGAIEVEAGTLIISLLSKKSGELIWQGFASGLIRDNEFVKDEIIIREAVGLLFQDYGYRLNEYTRR